MIDLFDMFYWNQYDINKEELLDYLGYIKDIQKLGSRELKYFEKHHIIPKSIDITFANDKDNLIVLSGREHFIAHQKLLKFHYWQVQHTIKTHHSRLILYQHLQLNLRQIIY